MSPEFTKLANEVWGDPSQLPPDQLDAFHEWCQCYEASEDEYQEYYRQWVASQDEAIVAEGDAQWVRMLSYGCVAQGRGTETGTFLDRWITSNPDDGNVSQLAVNPHGLFYGSYYVIAADSGVENLPPSEDIKLVTQSTEDTEEGDAQSVSAQYWVGCVTSWHVFDNITIPQGYTIQKAVLKYKTFNAPLVGDDFTVRICCADYSVTPPGSWATNWLIPRTDNRKDWLIDVSEHNYDTTHTSADFACALQEIIDRPDWYSGKSVMVLVDCIDPTYGAWLEPYDYADSTPSGDTSDVVHLWVWYTAEYTEDMNGGAVCGGTADVGGHWYHEMDGGYVANSTAQEGGTTTIVTSGGAKVNGTAKYGILYIHVIDADTGGFVGDGTAGGMHWFVSTGGALAGSTAEVAANYYHEMEGGWEASDAPFSNGYTFRRMFRVPAGVVDADIDKFYLMVSCELDHFDGTNMAVTTDDGTTELASQLVKWNGSRIHFVVKTPLDADSSTDYYLYYNGDA